MNDRSLKIIAFWFVLQIVLPFTAPLQTCDVRDLFNLPGHRAPASHESSSVPPVTEAKPEVKPFVSPLDGVALAPVRWCEVIDPIVVARPLTTPLILPQAVQVQQSVLRL